MDGKIDEPAVGKPLWRRIVDFPLVTMVLSLAILVLVLVGVSFLAASTVGTAAEAGLDERLVAVINGIVVPLLAFATYKLVLRRLGAHPRDDLPLRPAIPQFVIGALFAAVLMSAIVGIAALLGGYQILGWGGSTSLMQILFIAGLQAGFLEELIVRGIIFRYLEETVGSWLALLLSAALFGFAHITNDNATLLSSVAIAIEAGILLGGAYMLTRNLWLAIGIHFGWNVVQGYIWDVPVSGGDVDGLVNARAIGDPLISGGAFGLEASVVAMVLATGAGVAMVWLAMRRGNVVRPLWARDRSLPPLPHEHADWLAAEDRPRGEVEARP